MSASPPPCATPAASAPSSIGPGLAGVANDQHLRALGPGLSGSGPSERNRQLRREGVAGDPTDAVGAEKPLAKVFSASPNGDARSRCCALPCLSAW